METLAPSIITGIVTALGSILGFIATIHTQKQKTLDAHEQKQNEFQKQINDKLDEHRDEYLGQINSIKASISEMKSSTDKWQSNMEIRFDNLEQKVMKHNNFMERVAVLEKDVAVLQNRESVSEHRLTDLENHEEK